MLSKFQYGRYFYKSLGAHDWLVNRCSHSNIAIEPSPSINYGMKVSYYYWFMPVQIMVLNTPKSGYFPD